MSSQIAAIVGRLITKVGKGPTQYVTLEILRSRVQAVAAREETDVSVLNGGNEGLRKLSKILKQYGYPINEREMSDDVIPVQSQTVAGYVLGPGIAQFIADNYEKDEDSYIVFPDLVEDLKKHLGDELFYDIYVSDRNLGRHMVYQGCPTENISIKGVNTSLISGWKRKLRQMDTSGATECIRTIMSEQPDKIWTYETLRMVVKRRISADPSFYSLNAMPYETCKNAMQGLKNKGEVEMVEKGKYRYKAGFPLSQPEPEPVFADEAPKDNFRDWIHQLAFTDVPALRREITELTAENAGLRKEIVKLLEAVLKKQGE